MYLLGHSWGSILAMEYYRKFPQNVAGIIFVSPCLSIQKWNEDSAIIRESLSRESQRRLYVGENTFTFSGEEYRAAEEEYYQRCIFDTQNKPETILYCDASSGTEVYGRLWGVNEFTVSGILKDYDSTEYLSELSIPTLFMAGDQDEVLPETLAWYADQIPGSESVIVTGARHLPMFEQRESFNKGLTDFLARVL